MTTEHDLYERIQEELNKYIGGMQDEKFSRHDLILMQSAFIYGMKVGLLMNTEHTKLATAALDRHAENLFGAWVTAPKETT